MFVFHLVYNTAIRLMKSVMIAPPKKSCRRCSICYHHDLVWMFLMLQLGSIRDLYDQQMEIYSVFIFCIIILKSMCYDHCATFSFTKLID